MTATLEPGALMIVDWSHAWPAAAAAFLASLVEFVEALTIHDGHVYTEMREVIVPPEKRVLNVEVLPSQKEYKPGEKATVKVKVTDFFGKPFIGALVLLIGYIAAGTLLQDLRQTAPMPDPRPGAARPRPKPDQLQTGTQPAVELRVTRNRWLSPSMRLASKGLVVSAGPISVSVGLSRR